MIFNKVFNRDGIVLQLKIYPKINYNNIKIINIKRKRPIKVDALNYPYEKNIFLQRIFTKRPVLLDAHLKKLSLDYLKLL